MSRKIFISTFELVFEVSDETTPPGHTDIKWSSGVVTTARDTQLTDGPTVNNYGVKWARWNPHDGCVECGRRGYWEGLNQHLETICTWCDDCELNNRGPGGS